MATTDRGVIQEELHVIAASDEALREFLKRTKRMLDRLSPIVDEDDKVVLLILHGCLRLRLTRENSVAGRISQFPFELVSGQNLDRSVENTHPTTARIQQDFWARRLGKNLQSRG